MQSRCVAALHTCDNTALQCRVKVTLNHNIQFQFNLTCGDAVVLVADLSLFIVVMSASASAVHLL